MKIIYIDPVVHSEVSRTYKYYNGLYDALDEKADCFLCSRDVKNIQSVIDECHFKPDVIVFGLGWNKFERIEGLEKFSSIFFMFKPQNNLECKLRFCSLNKIGLILSSVPYYKDYEVEGVSAKRFCYAADKNVFKKYNKKKVYDVGFSGALHNNRQYVSGAFDTVNIRDRLQNMLAKEKRLNTFLNGSDLVDPRIKSYQEYAKKISQSKIWLATNAAFGDMTPRYFEIPMSGTLLMCNEVPDTYKDIFRDGETCVEFSNDLSDFLDKIHYYLGNWEKSQEIINRAAREFRRNHTWDERALQFLQIIKDLKANANK